LSKSKLRRLLAVSNNQGRCTIEYDVAVGSVREAYEGYFENKMIERRIRKIEKIGNDWIVKSKASPNSPWMSPGCWIEIIWPQRNHHGEERG
jgi:hypothetical protein